MKARAWFAIAALFFSGLLFTLFRVFGHKEKIPSKSIEPAAKAVQADKEAHLEKTPAAELVASDPVAADRRDQSVVGASQALRNRIRDRLEAVRADDAQLGRGSSGGSGNGSNHRRGDRPKPGSLVE